MTRCRRTHHVAEHHPRRLVPWHLATFCALVLVGNAALIGALLWNFSNPASREPVPAGPWADGQGGELPSRAEAERRLLGRTKGFVIDRIGRPAWTSKDTGAGGETWRHGGGVSRDVASGKDDQFVTIRFDVHGRV